MRRLRALSVSIPVFFTSTMALLPQASAQAETAATGAEASAESSAARTHDGFLFRIALGFGYMSGTNKLDDVDLESDVTSGGLATELAFGGTPAPGLVIGGAGYGFYAPSPKAESSGVENDTGAMQVGGLGPFIDYYFDPHGGGHIGASLMLASATVAEKDQQPAAAGIGFGAMLMGGYDFWVGDEWSLGILGRIGYYNVKLTLDAPTDPTSTYSAIIPAVLFGATYH